MQDSINTGAGKQSGTLMVDSALSGMIHPVDSSQIAVRYMRVYLRGREVAVAEEFLDGTQVSTVAKHLCCKTVSQRVWRRRDGDAGLRGILLDHIANGDDRQSEFFARRHGVLHTVRSSNEEGSEMIQPAFQVSVKRICGGV